MKSFNTIDGAEAGAATEVFKRRLLSGYIGSDPYGGPAITELERDWKAVFKTKYAVAVNSATSGLLAACMAVGVEPDDEVIVSPYTMSATAAAPKVLGAKIIWADIEPETFTLDPVEVANRITRKTKAVIVTNLFGHPGHLQELRDICDSEGVYLIEDNAQAIFAMENGKFTGTIGHIGVFSLNVHKQLQVGEGGLCVTNSSDLDRKLRAAMNHGEMRGSILGLNLRMTEITAAMAIQQLKKAPEIMETRLALVEKLTRMSYLIKSNVTLPIVRPDCTHSYYVWALQLKQEPRKPIPAPFRQGYLRPLYDLPAFKSPDSLPTVEEVERNMVLLEICSIDPTNKEIDAMMLALRDAL